MDILYIVITIIATVLLTTGLVYVLMNKKFRELGENKKDDQSVMMLNQNIQSMQKDLNQRLDNAARVVGQVSKELGSVQEMGRNMQDLQNFLKSPKLRGNIGEQVLQDMLEQFFPQKYWQMQYKFKEGQMVDAILKTEQGMIGIDSKFPLENFQKMVKAETEEETRIGQKDFVRDVKKHVQDIGKKYIIPEEGTVDFAVMYVPSEAIYYEIIRNDIDLQSHAWEKKVLVVSPNSFYYFLKVILMGMQGQRIESATKKMMEMFQAIARDSDKFGEELGVMGRHLTNAHGSFDRIEKSYNKLSSRIDQVKLLK
ncbi:DNA recombination protein RmuC [Patescibacteria group bacterium]|nr:DNA recombination protein RmuC [Patescibacteria group bacterium]